MNQTKIKLPPMINTKPTVEFSKLLNGTSADMRFLSPIQYTASGETNAIEVDYFDENKYYRLLKKRSAVLEVLQKVPA
jgi:hypothetical protein